MYNLLFLICGSVILIYLIFVRAFKPINILSSTRWLVFAWGILALAMVTAPITYRILTIRSSTIVYVFAWLGLYIMGEHLGFTGLGLSGTYPTPAVDRVSPRLISMCKFVVLISIIGAILFGIMDLRAAESYGTGALLSRLRAHQLNAEMSLGRTVVQFLAMGGLPAALILLSHAVTSDERPSPLAWAGLAAPFLVNVFAAGRGEIVHLVVTITVVLVFGLRHRVTPYRALSFLIAPIIVGVTAGAIYFTVNVVTRSTAGGTMDDKLEMIGRVFGIEMSPDFRRSIRWLGPIGDSVSELYFYTSTQLPGLDATLTGYQGPHGYGLDEVPYFTRRLEWLLQVDILKPIWIEDTMVTARLGIAGNFFRSAVHSTFLSFGKIGGLCSILIGGFLAGLLRRSVVIRPSPMRITMQALLCSGAAFTVIFTPFFDMGWAFPMMWLGILALLGGKWPRSRRQPYPS